MAEVQNNNAGKSFAERYAKKPSFTSESMMQKSAAQPQSNAADIVHAAQNAAPQKAIDPMKRMQADLIYLVIIIMNGLIYTLSLEKYWLKILHC